MLRATVMAAIFSMLSTTIAAAPCAGFADVDDSDALYCSAIAYVKYKGITLGCTGAAYCPDDVVTRLQMALFLQRMGRGGPHNMLGQWNNTIAGGDYNDTSTAAYASIGGGYQNSTIQSSATIAGGLQNQSLGSASAIGGGQNNSIGVGNYSTIAGGDHNQATDSNATVGGGSYNHAGTASTVAGGGDNMADNVSFVGGGADNRATGVESVIAGGTGNRASGSTSAILGGQYNHADGTDSAALGGLHNSASGNNSVAIGSYTDANRSGCIVIGDMSSLATISCSADNEFLVRAQGGVRLITGFDGTNYSGAALAAGSTSWTTYSDRNGKENVEAVNPQTVLAKLVGIPIATWNWKSQAADVRHIGPMAQDFAAAFQVGETSRGINTVDADGVALAAIQGLNAKLETRDAIITEQSRKLDHLEAVVRALAERLAQRDFAGHW